MSRHGYLGMGYHQKYSLKNTNYEKQWFSIDGTAFIMVQHAQKPTKWPNCLLTHDQHGKIVTK